MLKLNTANAEGENDLAATSLISRTGDMRLYSNKMWCICSWGWGKIKIH